MRTSNCPGYILPLTLAMMGLCMFLASYIANKGLVFNSYTTAMLNRQKAQHLAYGAVQLAISELSFIRKQDQKPAQSLAPKAPETQIKEQESDGQRFLKTILPMLNKPQQFVITQSVEGIDGSLGFALGSEEGKININRLYDFEKHAFVGQGAAEQDMRKFFQEIFALLSTQLGVNLFEDFEKFLKERKYPLNDVTELLLIKSFSVFKDKLFYNPFTVAGVGRKNSIYLTDLFTVASFKKEIEPWLFSESLKNLFKINPNKVQAPYEQVIKNFKEKSNWKVEWDTSLKQLYDKAFAELPVYVTSLFNQTFSPQLFWVLAYGTYIKTTVVVWALVEREQSSKGATAKIRRIYAL